MLIKNECTNPPYGLLKQVRRSLAWISPLDLDGIAFILLADEIGEPNAESPEWHKTAKAEGIGISGMYVSQQKNSPAHIILYIRDLYRGIPSFYWWTTVPTLNNVYTLAHEVGHHLIEKRGYIFQPDERYKHDENEEDFCNRYAFNVTQKMMGHWYYRLGAWALRDLAGWYYIFGCLDWKEKKYKKAAERFYTAFHLDRNREDALNWYRRAKELSNA
jgi:hypothetical protein